MTNRFKKIILNGEESIYSINVHGEVRNDLTNKILSNHLDNDGYVLVTLQINGKSKGKRIHRLLAEAFIPNPNKHPIVNHKDGDTGNYELINLEWCSYSYNNKHAYDTGLKKSIKGEALHFNKHKEETIIEICDKLMQGYRPKDISEDTGISVNTIYSILYKQKWKHITQKYDFPKMFKHSKKYSTELKLTIIKMFKEGKSMGDVLEATGITRGERNKMTMLRYYRDEIKNGRKFND